MRSVNLIFYSLLYTDPCNGRQHAPTIVATAPTAGATAPTAVATRTYSSGDRTYSRGDSTYSSGDRTYSRGDSTYNRGDAPTAVATRTYNSGANILTTARTSLVISRGFCISGVISRDCSRVLSMSVFICSTAGVRYIHTPFSK